MNQLNNSVVLQEKIREIISEIIADTETSLNVVNILQKYVQHLCIWYKTHNIISRQNTDYDIWENVYDSIALVSFIESQLNKLSHITNKIAITDAGAGGGFPGIPLAIVLFNIKFYLVDINRKKCSFLRSIRANLLLKNVVIINKNIVDTPSSYFVVTKAAFPPSHIAILSKAVERGGKLVIWATPKTCPQFDLELGPLGFDLTNKCDYFLPSGKERTLLFFTKS